MEAVTVVLLLALLVMGGIAVVLLLAQRRPNTEAEAQPLELKLTELRGDLSRLIDAQLNITSRVENVDSKVDEKLEAVRSTMDLRLNAVDNRLDKSLTSTQDTIKQVGERLGELSQFAQQWLQIGQNISSLQDILRPPKLRGGFGELQLERILADCGLPANSYHMQHRFPTGVQVDAVVIVGGGLVPVDSKFPMDGFNHMMAAADEIERPKLRRTFLRDVQKHVDACCKYILPDEGTFDFALMFIPAEGVYYETFFGDDDIVDETSVWMYALNRRVIPVSPSNFYAYLYALVLGLRGLQVDRQAREIIGHLGRLSGDFGRIREDFTTMGKHLKNTSDRYADVDRAFTKFGDRLAVTLNDPVQAPLPDPIAAPAPIGEPATTNGSDDSR